MSGPVDDPHALVALSRWAPELARTFVSLASDIALVIDDTGVIRNVAQGGGQALEPLAHGWVGRAWIDTVSGETRPKIERLLDEVASTGLGRRREVSHPFGAEPGIPIAYTAIRLGHGGPVLAVGRDLRAIASIQQRYVESQQEIERAYWSTRQAEARHALLSQVATDAVVVVDPDTLQIIEANGAASALYGSADGTVTGRHASTAFDHHSRRALNELLAEARRSGRSGEIRARLQGSNAVTAVVAMSFRSQDATRLLVRVRSLAAPGASAAAGPARDGIVITDSSGRVSLADPAFLALARLATEREATGQPLMHWLLPREQSLAALIARVRRDGIARPVAAEVLPAGGGRRSVEVSAALLAEGDQECIGFTLLSGGDASWDTDDGIEALCERMRGLGLQVGDRPLADLLGEAAALAERCFGAIARKRDGGDP